MARFEKSERLATGLALGAKDALGVSILPHPVAGFTVLIHIAYEDKDIAKDFGAKYSRKNGWHMQALDIQDACQILKEILWNQALVEAIGNKEVIELNVHYGCKDFDRAWAAAVAGVSPAMPIAPENARVLPPRENVGDVVNLPMEAEKEHPTGSIGVAMNEQGPIGFAIDTGGYYPGTNAEIKRLASAVKGKAKWNPDKKIWIIPLEAATLINSSVPWQRDAVAAVFGTFPWTDAAREMIALQQAALKD